MTETTAHLAEIDLEPLDGAPIKGPGEDQAHLPTFLGRTNRVRLGRPRVADHLAELRAAGDVPGELERHVRTGGSVLAVRPTLTLLPASGCVFVDVDFALELIATPVQAGQTVGRPLAYAVRPDRVVEEVPVTHTAKTVQEIGGEAGAGLGKLIAKITQENAFEEKGKRYTSRIYGYGVNFYEVGWRLRATTAADLAGDITGLEVVVQVPTGATLAGRFRVAAEIAIQAGPDRWLTRTFGPRRTQPTLDVVYDLHG
ncbi:hypothetical protein BFF78_02085 [Streptomyces fodineus]|uniref:Uncharacterized protein n=1 Tax=Streptomyces fodineus TaxID=1904616 RepID=A0A1D7Y365_9ACTN|nr:hypothetical protein [Streptomyces fodineus]AOR30023.1 hypothetical protein BFF78_02085 [Streptomyces fodineus]